MWSRLIHHVVVCMVIKVKGLHPELGMMCTDHQLSRLLNILQSRAFPPLSFLLTSIIDREEFNLFILLLPTLFLFYLFFPRLCATV